MKVSYLPVKTKCRNHLELRDIFIVFYYCRIWYNMPFQYRLVPASELKVRDIVNTTELGDFNFAVYVDLNSSLLCWPL